MDSRSKSRGEFTAFLIGKSMDFGYNIVGLWGS